MAETLGSLVDKLTIVKLKEFHSDDAARLASLAQQQERLVTEIDTLLAAAASGRCPVEDLTFDANKVHTLDPSLVAEASGSMGTLVANLARTNSELWHQQEKVYAFETVPAPEKDRVIKRLAVLNLERNRCIDAIDAALVAMIKKNPA